MCNAIVIIQSYWLLGTTIDSKGVTWDGKLIAICQIQFMPQMKKNTNLMVNFTGGSNFDKIKHLNFKNICFLSTKIVSNGYVQEG